MDINILEKLNVGMLNVLIFKKSSSGAVNSKGINELSGEWKTITIRLILFFQTVTVTEFSNLLYTNITFQEFLDLLTIVELGLIVEHRRVIGNYKGLDWNI